MYKRVYGAVLLALLVLTITPLTQSIVLGSGAKETIVYVYAPCLDYNEFKEYTSGNNTFITNTSVTKIYPKPPYTTLYYELILLTGGSYSLEEGIPLDKEIMLWNKTLVNPLNTIDQDMIKELWGSIDTVFLYTRIVDPVEHPRTVNPYVNYSSTVIPATAILLKPGVETKWDLLNTSLELTVSNGNYTIDFKNYKVSVTISGNETPTVLLNITSNTSTVLEPGIYKFKIALFSLGNNTYLLITPGTRRDKTGLSGYYKDFAAPINVPEPFSKELWSLLEKSVDATKWVIKESIDEYVMLAKHVIKKKTRLFMYIYYPFLELIKRYRGHLTREVYEELIRYAYEKLYDILDTVRDTISESYIEIISPYNIVEPEKFLTVNTTEIAPGIIEYSSSVIDLFIRENVSFTIEYIGGKRLVFYTPLAVSINNGYAVGYGYHLVYPVKQHKYMGIASIDYLKVLAQYITGTKGYGFKQYMEKVRKLDEDNKKLEAKVNDLNTTVRKLRQRIDAMNKTIGDYEAEILELKDKINNMTEDMERIKSEREQVMLYLTAGIGSIIVLSIVFILLIRSIAKKKY